MNDAQKRLNEIEAEEKQLAEEKKKLLEVSKDADLQLVKKLCKQHGFTATQLRGCLATKGKKKTTSTATAEIKPAAKKPATKSKSKTK